MKDRKEIQEQRIRQYFMEATKETLKGEGLKAVNVRTVSERAGYSYATLYNYFKDLNELIFLCVKDFIAECEALADERSQEMPPGSNRLKTRMKAYIDYFIQYPGIFELMFLENIRQLNSRESLTRHIYEMIDKLAGDDLQVMQEEGIFTPQQADMKLLLLKNSITGLLLFYNNRMEPGDYREMINIFNWQLDEIVGK